MKNAGGKQANFVGKQSGSKRSNFQTRDVLPKRSQSSGFGAKANTGSKWNSKKEKQHRGRSMRLGIYNMNFKMDKTIAVLVIAAITAFEEDKKKLVVKKITRMSGPRTRWMRPDAGVFSNYQGSFYIK